MEEWECEVVERENGQKELEDKFKGNVNMKHVKEKKYLGNIISDNGTNTKHINESTNKALGTINKIMTALHERPYGRHLFKAAKLMS